MTYDEMTLFARFLQDKGMQQNYGYFYQNHRFDKRTLDTFLEQTEAEDAILSAFDLAGAPNTIFSPKFWQELHNKWMKKLTDFRNNGNKLEAMTILCEHCGRQMPRSSFALNAKGQLHKYCRECESGEWDRKRKEEETAIKEREKNEKAIKVLEKEIAEKQAKLERLSRDTAGTDPSVMSPTSQEGLSPSVSPSGTDEPIAPDTSGTGTCVPSKTAHREPVPAVSPIAAETDTAAKYSPKLGEHDATLHYKPETRKIVFNAVLSAYIYTKGLTKCYLNSKSDGRQFLIFNNAEGANVTWLAMRTSRLAQVCSTAHCRQIADFFHLTIGDLYYLHVTKNLSKTDDIINVEIVQVHTREEFAGIAARREEAQKAGRPVPGEDIPEYETAPVSHPESGDCVLMEQSSARGGLNSGIVPVDDAPLIDFTEPEPEQEDQKPSQRKSSVPRVVPKDTKVPDPSVSPKPTTSPFGAAIRSKLDTGQSLLIPLSDRNPSDLLQQLIDRNHMTERDIAKFLYDKGWKLQEPVVVTTHKKFKA